MDTSAAARLLVGEPESSAVAGWLDRRVESGEAILSSLLLEAELRRFAAREQLPQMAFGEVLDRVDLVEPDGALLPEARILPGTATGRWSSGCVAGPCRPDLPRGADRLDVLKRVAGRHRGDVSGPARRRHPGCLARRCLGRARARRGACVDGGGCGRRDLAVPLGSMTVGIGADDPWRSADGPWQPRGGVVRMTAVRLQHATQRGCTPAAPAGEDLARTVACTGEQELACLRSMTCGLPSPRRRCPPC